MAIEFARSHIISRSDGHSAVKAAAYRSGERLNDDRIGKVVDYAHRHAEVVSSEILLPEGADPRFADRETLWSAVESREDQHNRRASAQLAKDHIIALPKELTLDQQISLARDFAKSEFVSRGLVVDLNIHYHSDGNPHAHLLTTTRALEGDSFGAKLRDTNGKFYGGKKIADIEQLRHRWADFQNAYFRENNIEIAVSNNNGEYESESHLGAAHAMEKAGLSTSLGDDNQAKISGRAAALLNNPSIIIDRVSDRKSLFTKHDLYRELHNLVSDSEVFATIKSKIDNHYSLVGIDDADGHQFFTTQQVLEDEQEIRALGDLLIRPEQSFDVKPSVFAKVIERQSLISEEQTLAAKHLTGAERLGIVVGLAGTGKSTMLQSLRESYEGTGKRVTGVTLSGIAAEGLSESAGIESRTIASWLLAVKQGRVELSKRDVVVMDEAGMVNNRVMLSVMKAINQASAKLVQIGDGEQLQAIQTGCPFRDLSERLGASDIDTVRRQRVDWQREATYKLSKGQGHEALGAYQRHGHVHTLSQAQVFDKLVSDYVGDVKTGQKAIFAHRRKDVAVINTLVRESLKEDGLLAGGLHFKSGIKDPDEGIPMSIRQGDEVVFTASDRGLGVTRGELGTYLSVENGTHRVQLHGGAVVEFHADRYSHISEVGQGKDTDLELSAGDRLLFTKNDRTLGVKNGMLGTLSSFKNGVVSVRLDNGNQVKFTNGSYSHIAHGYATTIHKSQGMTVDRAYLYGSITMDKHLGYVSLSRHRDNVEIYLPAEHFRKESFGSKISKANRQETVLSFAERHGLEYDPGDPQRTEFRTPAINNQEDSMDTTAATETGTQANPTFEQANQLLESARQQLIGKLQNEQQTQIDDAQRQARIAERALVAHEKTRPKAGLLRSKTKIAAWEKTLADLSQTSEISARSLAGLQTERSMGQESLQRKARREVEARYPEAAQVVREQTIERKTAGLVQEWNSIERDIAQARGRPESENLLPELHKKLDTVLWKLKADKDIASSLTADLKQRLSRSQKAVSNEQRLENDRSRGRGLDM